MAPPLPCTPNLDARILRIATQTHGVVTFDQLRDQSVTSASITRRIHDGRLHRVASGVYVLGGPTTGPGELLAAVRSGGSDAHVSHETAAEHRGHWKRPQDPWIHVTSTRQRRTGGRRGVIHHRSRSGDAPPIVEVAGIPASTVAHEICDLGTVLTPHQLAAVLARAAYLRDLDLAEVRRLIRARHGHRGIAVVRHALELHLSGSAGTRSRSEDHLLRQLLHIFTDAPVVNTPGATGVGGYECDFVYPQHRLILEVDGGGHDQIGARIRDLGQDDAHRSAGWVVLRIPHERVWHDMRRVLETIATARAQRALLHAR